ncbi:hypothetical protein ACFVYR_18480 [Streptomyces sp. NPDC058284]|uniref:hypothetical protein n=1 Tax=unclassified Streptomyces TaxID=2593676 RepID=UPI003656E6BE
MVWLRYIRTGPPGALLMVGKTERTLKRNIIDVIEQMVGKRRCVYRAVLTAIVTSGGPVGPGLTETVATPTTPRRPTSI